MSDSSHSSDSDEADPVEAPVDEGRGFFGGLRSFVSSIWSWWSSSSTTPDSSDDPESGSGDDLDVEIPEDAPSSTAFALRVTNLFRTLINRANTSGIADAFDSEERETSFINLFYPDMSYRLLGPFRSLPTESHEVFILGWFSKILYETPERIERILRENWLHTSLPGVEDSSLLFHLGFVQSSRTDAETFCLVCGIDRGSVKTPFVVFRGTKFFSEVDWGTDFDFRLTEVERADGSVVRVHRGFWNALTEKGEDGQSLWEKILQELNVCLEKIGPTSSAEEGGGGVDQCVRFYVSGHSMGGALAAVFGTLFEMRKSQTLIEIAEVEVEEEEEEGEGGVASSPSHRSHEEENEVIRRLCLKRVVTFGAPRIGTEDVASIAGQKTTRVVNDLDIVPEVPPWYVHCGEMLLVTRLAPVRMQRYLREHLPLMGFNMTDHYPGAYLASLAKLYGFPSGSKAWQYYEENDGEQFQAHAMLAKIVLLKNREEELLLQVEELKAEVARLKNQDEKKGEGDMA